jgi:galactokinase
MTGGGFCGCSVNLVASDAFPAFVDRVRHRYLDATGIVPMMFPSRPVAGVQTEELDVGV